MLATSQLPYSRNWLVLPFWSPQTQNIPIITESSIGQHWTRELPCSKLEQKLIMALINTGNRRERESERKREGLVFGHSAFGMLLGIQLMRSGAQERGKDARQLFQSL